jgi:hypothetical protein
MIYDIDGTPLQGITGGFGGDRRVEYIIPVDARTKGTHEFIIESSCNGMFGVPWNGDTIAPPDVCSSVPCLEASLLTRNFAADEQIFPFGVCRFGRSQSRSVAFALGFPNPSGNSRLGSRKHGVSTVNIHRTR